MAENARKGPFVFLPRSEKSADPCIHMKHSCCASYHSRAYAETRRPKGWHLKRMSRMQNCKSELKYDLKMDLKGYDPQNLTRWSGFNKAFLYVHDH